VLGSLQSQDPWDRADPSPQASWSTSITVCAGHVNLHGVGREGAAAGREPESCLHGLCSGRYWVNGESLISVCGSRSAAVFHAQNGLSVAKTDACRLPVGLVPSAAAFVGRFYGHVVSDNKSGLPCRRRH